jgi:hypothetical protein
MPDRPEHPFRDDPAKSDANTATTLSWLGDPVAVDYARQVLARLRLAEGSLRIQSAVSGTSEVVAIPIVLIDLVLRHSNLA